MLYKLNNSIGIILLIIVFGGGALYGLVTFLSAPPLLRQSSQGDSPYQQQARKDMERRIQHLQQQSSDAIQRSIEIGQCATSS